MSSRQQQHGVLGTLIRPGWDAAEVVIPFLHKCLFALLCVLLYTAQHNDGALRTHLLCMAGLTLGLWASVAWCVRACLRRRRCCCCAGPA
jgi:tryptophan-rich sensory protein